MNAELKNAADTPMTVREALAWARAQLEPLQAAARLEAEVLLAQVLGATRSRLHAYPDSSVPSEARSCFDTLVARRVRGEPVAYLTGRREFWSLDLKVTPDTLIPRPETERLVEIALAHIPLDASWRIADLGTGSGAIALALAAERPALAIVAIDASKAAAAVAACNAAALSHGNVVVCAGDWCAPCASGAFEMIVSNPPYIPDADPHLRQGDVRYEPREALAAGADGLDALRRVVRDSRRCLRAGGRLLLEHGCDQGACVQALLTAEGYEEIETQRDYADRPRVSLARWPGNRPVVCT